MSICGILDHAPIAAAICEHLNFISRLSLCRVFPILRSKIPGYLDFRHVVMSQLIKFFSTNDLVDKAEIAAEAILLSIQQTQTWMSGSFILKCLTGLDFMVGDIDFFTNNYISDFKKVYKLKDKITGRREFWEVVHPYISQFSSKMYQLQVFDTTEQVFDTTDSDVRTTQVMKANGGDENTKPSSAILYVRDFLINGGTIQDIIINDSYPIKEYIHDIFDMGFLKNMFDGNTLLIMDPESVLKQKTSVNLFQAYYKSFIHVTGYEKSDIDAKSEFMYDHYKRIMKYRDRGFVVDIDLSKDVKSVEKLCQRWGRRGFKMTTKALGLWDYIVNEEAVGLFEQYREEPEEEEPANDEAEEYEN